MDKKDYIEVFNAMVNGTPVSFQEKLLPMVSEYLTEIKYENYDKMINLIAQNPQMIQQTLPKLVEYYSNKYDILSVLQKDNFNNLKPILYYD